MLVLRKPSKLHALLLNPSTILQHSDVSHHSHLFSSDSFDSDREKAVFALADHNGPINDAIFAIIMYVKTQTENLNEGLIHYDKKGEL